MFNLLVSFHVVVGRWQSSEPLQSPFLFKLFGRSNLEPDFGLFADVPVRNIPLGPL